jgi:hypothetical protein
MNLLVRVARDLSRWVTPNIGFTAAVAGTLVVIEALGRQSLTDLHDLLALIALFMLGVLIAGRHRRAPLGWVNALARFAERCMDGFKRHAFEIGLDLRGEPRVKRGAPPIVITVFGILIGWMTLAAVFAVDCPRELRAFAARNFYLLYLAFLAIVWVGAILMTLLAGFLPYAMIHDALVAAHTAPGRRPRNREWVAVSLYFLAVLFAGTFLPVWISLAICLAIVAGYLLLCRLPVRASVQFLWRQSGTVRVRSLTWSDWVTWEFAVVALALGALILTTCGDRLGGGVVGDNMPITALMGIFLAWLAPGALGALFGQMMLGRARDPARPAPPIARMANVTDREMRAAIRRRFAEHGWRVRFSNRPATPLEVPLRFTATPILGGTGDAQWPLPVSHSEFEDPAFWSVIGRRNEIQLRRKLLTALERLFKVAGQRPARPGSGYWVAPHFWFVPGLMRDSNRDVDDEVDFADHALLSGTVGPPYHRLMPRSVRHHFWIMMRALQVDLLFVEDGVGFRRLRRVLRVLFEVFDMHAGRRPANEIDFRGLPGVRVLIHEFQFDEPFKSETYPEPKYDYLGRARILHVFRDRGGQEEFIEPPFDMSRSPAPMALG